MQGPRPTTPFGVPDRVGPGGYVGEVVRGVVAQEGLEVGGGGVGDEVAGDVGDGDVSEACCCCGRRVSAMFHFLSAIRECWGEMVRKGNWCSFVPPHAEAPPAKKAEELSMTDDSFMVVSLRYCTAS